MPKLDDMVPKTTYLARKNILSYVEWYMFLFEVI